MQKNVSAFWDWVGKRIDEIGLKSYSELEKRAGSGSGAIIKRKNENKFPTIEMAEGMCYALRVDWVELWTEAGFVDALNRAEVNPGISDLTGLDAELYATLRSQNDEFKKALLKTAKAWVLYEDLRK